MLCISDIINSIEVVNDDSNTINESVISSTDIALLEFTSAFRFVLLFLFNELSGFPSGFLPELSCHLWTL